jgi:protocatechuate 4,5-dioxygenase alpha chain
MSVPSGGRGVMTSWHASSRSISASARRRDHPQRQARRLGAQAAQQGGSSRSRCRSLAAMVMLACEPRRVETGRGAEGAHARPAAGARAAPAVGACAVATMPRPDFTNSGSPTMARSLSSRWLTADWVTPRRCAARVTEPALVHRQQQLQQVAVEVQMIELAHGSSVKEAFSMSFIGPLNTALSRMKGLIPQYCRSHPDSAGPPRCHPDQETPEMSPSQPIPGTTRDLRRRAGHEGLCAEQDVLLVQRRPTAPPSWPTRTPTAPQYGLNERSSARPSAPSNVLQLIAAGGNAYYLAKFAGIFGLDMQDIGAQQTGMTKDEFKAKLLAARG